MNQALNFSTTGESFQNLLIDFILSGEFEKVISILDKQLPKETPPL